MRFLLPMYVKMRLSLDKLQEERGATMVEYALMVALIAAVAAAIVGTLGSKVNTVFSNVNATLK